MQYLDHGLSIIPLNSPKTIQTPEVADEAKRKNYIDKCKRPIIAWTEYQRRLPTREEVTEWFTENPDANIGIVTGKVSGIVVFDLDSDDAKKFAEEQGGFPATPMVISGRGVHVYMKYPGFEVRNNANTKLKIDIRGDGGQVVAPPSIHATGREYQWKEGQSIFDVEPAECLPWMIDYLKSIAASKAEPKPEKISKPKDVINPAGHDKTGFAEIIATGCKEGERNDTAARIIGHLMKTGMDDAELWEIIGMWNEKNAPPLTEWELQKTFESIKQIESQNQKPKLEISSFLYNATGIVSGYDKQHICIPFGRDNLSGLENHMNGGLFGSRFYILGGIPSSAKTALVNNMADNICLNDQPVLFFSYDDGRDELLFRTFARFSKHSIEAFNVRSVSKHDIEVICSMPDIQRIITYKYIVEENIPVEEWEQYISKIFEKHKRYPVVIIDYLRKLITKRKITDERLRVDCIMSNLTELAKKFNIPVLAISELARDSYKTKQRLGMASFKETGSIEYEASWLGILAAVEEKDGEYSIKDNWEKILQYDGSVDLIVFKTKRGTGRTGKVPLHVERNKMLVSDRDFNESPGTIIINRKRSKFGGV